MKGSQLNDWRTVQIFISPTGVHEVQLRPDSDEPRCNCASYKIRASCKHTKFIQARMAENDGLYAILVPENGPEELAEAANADPIKFREFVLKYARVEIL